MNIRVQSWMIPYLLELVRRADARGIRVIFISGFRSRAHQARLYAAWLRRGKKGLPAAPPGKGFHEKGEAVDFRTEPPGHEATVGHIGEALGFRWGGRFSTPDPPHLDAGYIWDHPDI